MTMAVAAIRIRESHPTSPSAVAKTTTDPVCGRDVSPATAKFTAEHDGTAYFFCSQRCHSKFTANTSQYLSGEATRPPSGSIPEGTIYTCPMHPQIHQMGPGSCPICGMALEPETPSEQSGPNTELVDMTRRFWIASVLSLPVVVMGMGADLLDLHRFVSGQVLNWLQLLIATPIVLWAGWPFFTRGLASVKNRSLNMFTLIATGVGVAWLYSLVATVAPTALPGRDEDHGRGGGRLF